MAWSRHPATAWAMLAVALPVGGGLLWEIHQTIGLSSPRLWELLRTDRVFDLAMLDFCLTAGWAALVLIERSSLKDWRLWVSLPIFLVLPTLGIIAFILLDRTGRTPGPTAEVD
jgi:ABC-type molybdenum transport system ATPase subunit/photorepair protein PhrA